MQDSERQRRIRERAYRIWQEDGEPEGRAAEHWDKVTELVAIEENQHLATEPNPLTSPNRIGPHGAPIEPIEAVRNQGEFPTLTDQGEGSAPARLCAPRRPAHSRSPKW